MSRPMGSFDPTDKSLLLDLDMGDSGSGSGISENIGSPSDVESILYPRDQKLSFEARTADANILSIETSSEEEDEIFMDDNGMVQSFEDQAFAKNSTPLYEALRRREWRQAMVFLHNGSFMSRSLVDGSLLSEPRIVPPEEQVRTWVSMYETDGRLIWRRLPIHDALCRGAPADLIQTMLRLHPMSVEAKDWDGNLPLHLAMMYNAERMVVEMLLQEYPHAMEIRNDKGKLPLECVTMKGREAGIRGEILQRYVSSAKQVATQEVPKLKDKLFEVNKTIEAAKSELRLAKVELGMIKQQEKMRIQNKEKEETRMKEEVMRLKAELEKLRSEREELSEEKELWAEKAKQKILVVSDSDDSDDSQRSWIDKEFSQMVSELERTTLMSQQRKANSRPRAGIPPPAKLYYPSYHSKDGSKKSGDDDALKRSDTAATEASSDHADQLPQEGSFRVVLKENGSIRSIRSIREELELRRKKSVEHLRIAEDELMQPGENEVEQLRSRSSSSGGESIAEMTPRKMRSRSSSQNMEEIEEKLVEQIKKLESRSGSEDKGEGAQEEIEKNESRSSEKSSSNSDEESCSSDDSRGPGEKLMALDEKLTDVLSNHSNSSGNEGDLDNCEEMELLEVESSSKGSDSSASSSNRRKLEMVSDQANAPAFQERDIVRVDSTSSKSSSSSSVSAPTTEHRSSFPRDVALADSKESSSSSTSASSSCGSTGKSNLERGLSKVANQSSSMDARWNCNSMADDLTCQDEEEEEERGTSQEDAVLELPSARRIEIVQADESRDEEAIRSPPPAMHMGEGSRSSRRSSRHGHNVTFADQDVVFEDCARDGFSPQFRSFDDHVDRAMTRISRKTSKQGPGMRTRSRSRSQRRTSGRRSYSKAPSESRHIYITTDDKVEILGSELDPFSFGDCNSVVSASSVAVSEPGRRRKYNVSGWETGSYASHY